MRQFVFLAALGLLLAAVGCVQQCPPCDKCKAEPEVKVEPKPDPKADPKPKVKRPLRGDEPTESSWLSPPRWNDGTVERTGLRRLHTDAEQIDAVQWMAETIKREQKARDIDAELQGKMPPPRYPWLIHEGGLLDPVHDRFYPFPRGVREQVFGR